MKEKQLRVWRMMLQSLEQNIPVMLLYVLESHGSSPGRQGFFMAVNRDGVLEGSIGGGIMEHKLVEMAKDKLQHHSKELSVRKQIHDKAAAKNQSGMICSGEQTVLMYRVQAAEKTAIENIIACLEAHEQGLLQLSPGGLQFLKTKPAADYCFVFTSGEDWLYEEKLGYKQNLHIVGAGHCALALSGLMRGMDFYITIYDDRPELHTLLENTHVHQKKVLHDYSGLKELVPSGEKEYVVVMTMGYRTDDIAIRALLNKKLKYLGVLGSRKKIEKMFIAYAEEGIDKKLLAKIHAPAGLPVHSQTPEEIAVSIAAQIIQVKNEKG
jgi:xanthine dehydrogenase accessory factor